MLLQTLSTIVILLLLAGGLLTSSLLSAKVAFHRAMTRQVQVSLARGTDDFTLWAANYVYKHHANATWPSSWQSLSPQPVCATQQEAPSQAPKNCTLAQTTSYRVTGSTAATASSVNGAAGAPLDVAENLQAAVNEQRISAEVTSTITNADGIVVGSGTRELTVRVFDVPPWAVVTGTKDLSTVLGAERAAEGDTGGVAVSLQRIAAQPQPDGNNPSLYKDTAIRVKMSCVNSAANSNQLTPGLDNNAPGNNSMPWGVQASGRAFEAPCTPLYLLDPWHAAPPDATTPTDGSYDVGVFTGPKAWSNGSASSAGWSP